MFTHRVEDLPLERDLPLFVRVNPQDSLASWQRVGTLCRTDTRLRVQLDEGAAHVHPVWCACVEAVTTTGRQLVEVHFGVRVPGGAIRVVATGALSRRDLEVARGIAAACYGFDRSEVRRWRAARRAWSHNVVGPRPLRGRWVME